MRCLQSSSLSFDSMKNRIRSPRSSLVPVLLSSTRCMMNMLVRARGKCLPKEKASRKVVKAHSLNGDPHAMIIGNQVVAHKVIIAQSIIQGDSREDVQFAGLPDILRPQCTRPVKSKAKHAEWDESIGEWGEPDWQDDQYENEEYEVQKVKKGKGKGSKSKGKSKGKTTPKSIAPRSAQSSPTKNERSQPKPKSEARSCMTNDFLFAMMNTKSKPTMETLHMG